MSREDKTKLRKIYLEKVKIFFEKAASNHSKANDCVKKARRLCMRINISVPKEYKRKYCKHCNNYFRLGNYRVRTKNRNVVYSCFNCKKFMKFRIV